MEINKICIKKSHDDPSPINKPLPLYAVYGLNGFTVCLRSRYRTNRSISWVEFRWFLICKKKKKTDRNLLPLLAVTKYPTPPR